MIVTCRNGHHVSIEFSPDEMNGQRFVHLDVGKGEQIVWLEEPMSPFEASVLHDEQIYRVVAMSQIKSGSIEWVAGDRHIELRENIPVYVAEMVAEIARAYRAEKSLSREVESLDAIASQEQVHAQRSSPE